MKKIILSLGDTPNTGRTTVCEALQGLWQQRGMEHLRFHTAENQPRGPGESRAIQWRGQLSVDEMIGWLDTAPLVLVDVATGETDDVLGDVASEEWQEVLMEMSCSLTVLTSVTEHPQTEASLLKIAGQLRDDAEYVIVRPDRSEGWRLPACQRAMHHLDGVEITLPPWPPALEAADGAPLPHVLSLLAHEKQLPRMTQSWLRSWWLEYGVSLETAEQALWPEGVEAPSSYGNAMRPGTGSRSSLGHMALA